MLCTRTSLHLILALAVLCAAYPSSAQELRGVQEQKNERSLGWFDWLDGIWEGDGEDDADTTEEDDGNGGNFFSDFWNGLFGDDEDDSDSDPNPISNIIGDILDPDDGSDPIGDALNATVDSEAPLRDFLAELLNQPNSETPLEDFIDEAFNRTDTPLLDFIADLFNTTEGTPIDEFISDLIDGSTSPLLEFVNGLFGDISFEDLNCGPQESTCAYNLDGDPGVWVCRTLYNPINGTATKTTMCANPEFTVPQIDQCGACDEDYPAQQCLCSCDFSETGDGVLVTVDNVLTGGTEKQCVHKDWALGAVDQFDMLGCVAECQS